MNFQYSIVDLMCYFLIYSFLGWLIGVACLAVKERHFVNRGLLNLPLSVSEGLTAVILLLVLPTLQGKTFVQFIMTWGIVFIIDELTQQFVANVSRRKAMKYVKNHGLPTVGVLLVRTLESLLYLVLYLVLHPFVLTFVNWLNDWFKLVGVILVALVMIADFLCVRHTLHGSAATMRAQMRKGRTQRAADRMMNFIWRRLEKAYPGVERAEPEDRKRYTFAKGICFDKLVWVFLVSSFLGALIEMVFCFVTGGKWMNRSSVLYGTFSFVWGLGAVVLTVVLQRLAGKHDRYVFLAGCVIGGVYEYLCSVFTELVFGTVFWDYSQMPLNIGGRTNVLYCVFWGILAVVWVKILYPPMSKLIEKIPAVLGKIVTWIVIFVLLLDGVMTMMAMQRYTIRQSDPEADNFIEQYLDSHYDDAWMENRWPNMRIPETE